jgi:large subunit ribosomal protein L22
MRGLVRGLPVKEAEAQLNFYPGKAAVIVRQVLRSAVANAKNNFELDENNLKVADIIVGEGFRLKRFRPVSRGMAHPINKYTAHVTVVVEEQVATQKKRKKAATQIDTFTADQFAERKLSEQHHDHDEKEHQHETEGQSKVQETAPRPIETVKNKQEYEASARTIVQQGGGNRKQAQRRRSKKSK